MVQTAATCCFPWPRLCCAAGPGNPARLTGEPLNVCSKSFSSSEASHSSVGFTSSARASNSGSWPIGALRFHGHTSWQISHPNTCRPVPSISSGAIVSAMFNRQVGNTLRRIHLVRRSQRARRAGIKASPASPASIRNHQRRVLISDPQRRQQHRQKPIRPELRMNQARVLPRPSQPRRSCQRAFHHWSRIDVRSRFKFAKLLVQSRFKLLEPLQQHLVIIARPPLSISINATAPCIARDPRCLCTGRIRSTAVAPSCTAQNTQSPIAPREMASPPALLQAFLPRFGARDNSSSLRALHLPNIHIDPHRDLAPHEATPLLPLPRNQPQSPAFAYA